MKNLQITAVRAILTVKNVKPIVIIDVAGYKRGVVRIPKMLLIDLHNSGRLTEVPEGAFDLAPQAWNLGHKRALLKEIAKLRGGTVEGDITPVKAGDTYIVDANSTLFKEKKAKLGAKAVIKEDGMRVQGFLFLEINERKEQVEANADSYAFAKLSFFDTGSAFGSSSESSNEFDSSSEDEFEDFEDVETTEEKAMETATGAKATKK